MSNTYTLGKDGKLYLFAYNGRLFNDGSGSPDYSTPALIFASATEGTDYAVFGNCRDVTITTDSDEVDITSRETEGFKATAVTLKDSTIEFDSIWKKNSTAFQWLVDAWNNSTEIAVLAMDGAYDTAGNSGLIGNFTIPGFNREEPIGDVMKSSITLKGSSRNQWYEAS